MEVQKKKEKFDNKMREIKIEKLILNLCTGEGGDKLTILQFIIIHFISLRDKGSKGFRRSYPTKTSRVKS
jgi:hypothetical protein